MLVLHYNTCCFMLPLSCTKSFITLFPLQHQSWAPQGTLWNGLTICQSFLLVINFTDKVFFFSDIIFYWCLGRDYSTSWRKEISRNAINYQSLLKITEKCLHLPPQSLKLPGLTFHDLCANKWGFLWEFQTLSLRFSYNQYLLRK